MEWFGWKGTLKPIQCQTLPWGTFHCPRVLIISNLNLCFFSLKPFPSPLTTPQLKSVSTFPMSPFKSSKHCLILAPQLHLHPKAGPGCLPWDQDSNLFKHWRIFLITGIARSRP